MIRIEAVQLRQLAEAAIRQLDVADTTHVLDVHELTDGTWMVAFEDRFPWARFPSFEIDVQMDWSPEQAVRKLRLELRNKLWICPLCQRRAQIRRIVDQEVARVECDRCGRFEIEHQLLDDLRARHDAGDPEIGGQLMRVCEWISQSKPIPVLNQDNWRRLSEHRSS